MAIVYVCVTYDNYDPDTGLFNMIQDCIEWDTDTQGSPPVGATPYATLAECYEQSECVPQSNLPGSANNWCGISIEDVSLIEKNDNQITVEITLPQSYEDTIIECALYDIDNNLIRDWKKISTSDTLNPIDTYSINTTNNNGSGGSGSMEEICILAFRLVQQCQNISGGSN